MEEQLILFYDLKLVVYKVVKAFYLPPSWLIVPCTQNLVFKNVINFSVENVKILNSSLFLNGGLIIV